MDELKVTADVKPTDQPIMMVTRIEIEALRSGDLRNQAAAIVEKINYLGCELKVIEVDGVSNAVQIRSSKPAADGYIEIVLRGGRSLSFEKKGEPLRLSKGDYEKLLRDLKHIL